MPFTDIQSIWDFLAFLLVELWWFWLFIVLFFLVRSVWLSYVREHYRSLFGWVLIELKIPREVRKSPVAMEQVFMTIHAIRNDASDIQERWWDGEVPMWFSCEAVSFGGEIHFYMRLPSVRRNHVEAALYAQYPDIELTVVEDDYVNRLPPTLNELERAGYHLFGNELVLDKPDGYPIRSYVDFEAPAEERELDPISSLLETLSNLKPQENIWVQILVRPEGSGWWKKAGEKLIMELKETTGKRQMFSPQFGEYVVIDRSPGEVELLKAVDRNISKPGFDVQIRYLYIAPREIFSGSFGRRSILAALNQYASESLNKFAHNVYAWTIVRGWYFPYLFPKKRARGRGERLWENYRERNMFFPSTIKYSNIFMETVMHIKFWEWGFRPRKGGAKKLGPIVLNAEELATIFHLPSYLVLTGPLIKRVEARKGGPPAGLPIYGEEGEEKPPGA